VTEDKADDGPDVTAFAGIARDLTARFQDLVAGMARAGGSAPSGLAAQFRSVLESGATVTSMPVKQMLIVAGAIRQQREQIASMQAQLQLFDDQLKLLDDTIKPVVEFGNQWTKAQETMLDHLRRGS